MLRISHILYISLVCIYIVYIYILYSVCRPWSSIWQALSHIFYRTCYHSECWMFCGIENTWKTFAICVIFLFFPPAFLLAPILHATVPVLRSHLRIYIEGVLLALTVVSARHPIVFSPLQRTQCVCAIYKNYDTDTPNESIRSNNVQRIFVWAVPKYPQTHTHIYISIHSCR